MRVVDHAPLAPLTTLKLGGTAARLVSVESEAELVGVVREVDAKSEPLLLVGGGSNLVLADGEVHGTVVRIGTLGLRRVVSGDQVLVTAQAGEPWDAFVATACDDGLAGVECLAGIPGLVGAVPMQNVGAYGQDVAETIVRLRAWDRRLAAIVTIERDACRFAYRSSVFRGDDRFVLLDVTFALRRGAGSSPVRYAELARALGVKEGARAPVAQVRETILALRRTKGMVLDPSDTDTTSAGSFFTNPIVSRAEAERVQLRAADLPAPVPTFPEPDGRVKLSAAWLIEKAGFTKGTRSPEGHIAVSSKHALALTHLGGGTTTELVAFARTIRDGVRARFGVTLENEPVFVGVTL